MRGLTIIRGLLRLFPWEARLYLLATIVLFTALICSFGWDVDGRLRHLPPWLIHMWR